MVKTEIYCHECQQYITFDLDATKDGNHVIECPECGHEHCRVVENGRITSTRWDQRNGLPTITYAITAATTSATSITGGSYYQSTASSTTSTDNMAGSWEAWRSI